MPFLCIVIGLSWADFIAAYSPATRLSRAGMIKATIASSLFISAFALLFAGPDFGVSLLLLLAGAAIALFAARRVASRLALTAASLSFACYLVGAIP